MPIFEIDDNGSTYEVDAPDQQTALLAFSQHQRVGASNVASEMQKPDELAYRGGILPLGRTKEGKIVPAIPGFIQSALEGTKSAMEGNIPTGEQIAAMGSLGTVASPAATAAREAPGVIGAIRAGRAAKAAKPEIPTTEGLFEGKTAAYQASEQAGVTMKPEAFKQMVWNVVGKVKSSSFDRQLHPKSAAVLERFATEVSEGSAPTLSQFDMLRQLAGDAAASADKGERRVGSAIKNAMDDFMDNATAKDFSGGDSEAGIGALKQARELYHRYSKSESIDEMFDKAARNSTRQPALGFEGALRNQFIALANNKKQMRRFNKDEQDAIKKVAGAEFKNGQFKTDTVETAMANIGKLSPTAGFFSMVLSGEIGLHALQRPELLAIPLVGSVARAWARSIRMKRASKVSEMVRGGKPAAEFLNRKSQFGRQALSPGLQRGGLLSGQSLFFIRDAQGNE